MFDHDGNFMDITSYWDPLSSPGKGEALAIVDQNDIGQNLIVETFPETNLSPEDQSELRSGGLVDRMAARLGCDVPPLEIENVSLFVPSPLIIISPGFSLSPFWQCLNMFSDSSSQIIPPCPIPNDGPPDMLESSGGADAKMDVDLPPQGGSDDIPTKESVYITYHESNVEPIGAHATMNVDLPPQGGFDDIPTEESVYITSHESNVEPIGASLVPSFESEAVAETEVMNPISLESGNKDNNIVDVQNVKPPTRKRRKNVVSNMTGVTRRNQTHRVIIQVESEVDHPDDGFRWRKYGQKVVRGSVNPRGYYRCTYTGCKVRKYVERSAYNVKLVVATYDGIHEHIPPVPRCIIKSITKKQSGSSMSQAPRNQTLGLGIPPSSSSGSQVFSSSLCPQTVMDQNNGSTNQNDEPKIDGVIPDGTEVFKEIRKRIFLNYGINL